MWLLATPPFRKFWGAMSGQICQPTVFVLFVPARHKELVCFVDSFQQYVKPSLANTKSKTNMWSLHCITNATKPIPIMFRHCPSLFALSLDRSLPAILCRFAAYVSITAPRGQSGQFAVLLIVCRKVTLKWTSVTRGWCPANDSSVQLCDKMGTDVASLDLWRRGENRK